MTGQARQPTSARTASPEGRRWLDLATVERPVLDLRPDYTALIIVADGLHPGPSDEATDALLSDAEAQARATLAGRAAADLEPVAAWRLAYQAFGAKPKRTRPSVEALLRRVETGLPRIDRLTDIYNAISVRYLLPVGGEDLAMYHGPAAGTGGRRRAVRHHARRPARDRAARTGRGDLARRRRRDLPLLELAAVRPYPDHARHHQRRVHPRRPGRARARWPDGCRAGSSPPADGAPSGARLSWRQLGAVPESRNPTPP